MLTPDATRIPVAGPSITDTEIAYVTEAITTGWFRHRPRLRRYVGGRPGVIHTNLEYMAPYKRRHRALPLWRMRTSASSIPWSTSVTRTPLNTTASQSLPEMAARL